METIRFEELNCSEEIKKAVREMGFEEATPIQSMAIPAVLEGRDVVGQAQTGTGKTAAFGIPTIDMVNEDLNAIQTLVLCPTRELAVQISQEFKKLAKYKKNIRVLAVYGGESMEKQIRTLRRGVNIVIGTPGRVMDHMRRGTIKFDNLKSLVLDEADEMLNMGFREDIEEILSQIEGEIQALLFSATMKKNILEIVDKYFDNPQKIKVKQKELTNTHIDQKYIEVEERYKIEVLTRLIDIHNPKLSLIFCNTKRMVDEITDELSQKGYSCNKIHGDMNQGARLEVIKKFKTGDIKILVATDVAARGLDIDDVEMVFNYDVPNHEEFYVHRIGRTGRAGRLGTAITMTSPKEFYALKDIMSYTKMNITPEQIPSMKQLKKARTEKLMEDLKSTISEIDMDKYTSVLQEFEEEGITPVELAAVLLKNNLAFMDKEDIDMTPQRRQRNRTEGSRQQSRGGNREDVCRLFINIGKSKGVEPRDFVKFIAENGKIKGRVIGNIDIYDNYTFVNIPKEYEGNIVNALSKKKIKGCRINVEIAQNKPRERKRR